MIKEIKDIYSQLDDKPGFTLKVANKFKRKPNSIKVNWFSNFWSIPEDYQKGVKRMADAELKAQNRKQKQTA